MALTVSIVIVSRHRSAALRRCLIGLSQLDYQPYEVVIVADPGSCTALREVPQAAYAKLVPFDGTNISVGRNLGINAAAGEIIAFIDDDAVPEPTWLKFLMAPFSHSDTAAAGGYVRARNGISWQNRALAVDQAGQTAPIDLDRGQATILVPTENRAIRTDGSNMAFRRSVLEDIGGFDPRFRFFLGEADLNMRLASRGMCTAIVPMAEVHHRFAASARRRIYHGPRDLGEFGAGWAVFLGKYCAPERRETAWQQVKDQERVGALAHMVQGALEPRDFGRLMRSLQEGYAMGEGRQSEAMGIALRPDEAFQPVPPNHDFRSVVLSGRGWFRARLRRRARAQVQAGSIVTLVMLSPTALFHRVSFTPDGYWEHRGGIFGKSERTQALFSAWSFRRRVRAESDRVGIVRGLR